MNYSRGTPVCIHGFDEVVHTWIGLIESVHGDPGEGTFTVHVRQFGGQTTFPCALEELYETVMTFEGPRCTACKQTC